MKTRQYVSFDWAIKRLLRSKAHFGVLEGFLSELLKENITILEVQHDRDYSFFHQILWGTSRVVTEHLYGGDDYLRVHKVNSSI